MDYISVIPKMEGKGSNRIFFKQGERYVAAFSVERRTVK